MNIYLPWVEKYRPKNINDIISHTQNIETIKKLLLGESLPHLLFYGTPGTGKTSTILALSNEIYGKNVKLMVMKLDASDDRGINSVREDIKGFAEKSNMFQEGVRLIILDEADSMTYDAQFALRRIIEKYSSTVRFCLICNYENKIIPAIRSRCANFRFSNIDRKYILIKLDNIAKNENISYDADVLETIATLSCGDLRKAINLFQSISLQSRHITSKLCLYIFGIPTNDEINKILNDLCNINLDFDKTYKNITDIIIEQNYSLLNILKELTIIIINDEKKLNKFPNIISELSDLENMLCKTTFDDIYISKLVAIFKKNENSLY